MDLKTVHGRPLDESGRLQKEIDTYDMLDSLGIEYDRIDHEALFTIEACQAVDEELGYPVCKNLLLCNRQKTDFYLMLIPGEKHFDTKVVSGALGVARLSFAPGEMMEELVNITPGSLSIFGLMYDKTNRVRLLIDRELLDAPYLGAHPCINTSTLSVKTADILGKFLPRVEHTYTVI